MSDGGPSGPEVIDGYQVMADIASSSTANVLEVQEQGTGRRLAMKLLKAEHPDFKESKAGLKREASIAKTLDHPNIVKYAGFSTGRDNTYMVMEYFRAPNVKLQLKADINSVHIRLRKLVEGVCAAVQHMHERGWIHRDLKPDNVLMNKAGEVKLIDFSLSEKPRTGLAKVMGGKVKSIQGTRTYIAPETIRKRPAVLQTDHYSLGIMLFEILTGRTPFQGATPNEVLQKHLTAEPIKPSELNPNVSPDMDRIVVKLLSKKPENRGKDMAEIAGELRRISFFKEEPTEKKKDDDSKPTQSALEEMANAHLDSRMDAKRSALMRDNPEMSKQVEEKIAERKAEEARRKAERAARVKKKDSQPSEPLPTAQPPAQPAMPYQMPQMMPGMPMMAPGYPPGMPMNMGMPPGQMMPGMPMMPGMSPGMIPQAPVGYPPGAIPPTGPVAPAQPPGYPAGTVPPVAVDPRQVPAAQRPPATPAAAPARPASPRPAPQTPPPPAAAEDLEFMTELPDIL